MSQSLRDHTQVLKGAWREADQAIAVTGSGNPAAPPIPVASSGQLITNNYDEIDLTYYTSGVNVGQLETVTYKLQGNVVNTLTLSYDTSNNLTSVVKS